jgi:hypothetical protein
MASVMHIQALFEMMDHADTNALDLENDTKVKWMLLDSTYTADPDTLLVDAGGASDYLDAEPTITGYAGGYGGAGRLALASRAWSVDTANNRVEFDGADNDWGTLGNGSNATIVALGLIKEDHLGVTGNDTESRVIAYIDIADTTTNGGGFQAQWDAQGIIQFA